MRRLILIAFVLIGLNGFCQTEDFSESETRRLNNFNIEYTQGDDLSDRVEQDFQMLLKKDRQQQTQKLLGFGLSAVATYFITSSIINATNGDPYALSAAIGAVSAGGAIPLFNSSSKKRKERDVLIQKYAKEKERIRFIDEQ